MTTTIVTTTAACCGYVNPIVATILVLISIGIGFVLGDSIKKEEIK